MSITPHPGSLTREALEDAATGVGTKAMPIPMQDDEIVLSPAKYRELEAELERLQTVERRQIAERIKEARAMGDFERKL